MRFSTCLLTSSLLLATFAIAPAQDLKSLAANPQFPTRIKPADLGEDMRAYKITYEKQGGGGDLFSMLMNPMMMMMGAFGAMGGGEGAEQKPADPNEAAGMIFFDRMGLVWSNGSTVKLYDQEFLVTYGVQINMAEAMKSKNPPDLSKMDLTLTLINTKQITAITLRPDMTKAEWTKPLPTPPPAPPVKKDPPPSGAKRPKVS